ncbi:hypothetical protein [Cohnella nanjingensis]|uniref:Uncharacterized protein n=1 Tax=Cohnella nanjingensis TaxID=1387779 RepID=A0A7X0VDJ3_9BACL|nr:hypothetical protein [Cohnella nanjingensis]MBB6669263.1 hypothetical protein [Cohnella nanjingensis]
MRWHEQENELEVYAAVANTTEREVSFEASVVMLKTETREAAGVESTPLETDDRNGKTPFRLAPHNETVFHRSFKTNRPLTQAMLTKGVGIQIASSGKSYLIPISYGEVEAASSPNP